jgi:hypothetical protein
MYVLHNMKSHMYSEWGSYTYTIAHCPRTTPLHHSTSFICTCKESHNITSTTLILSIIYWGLLVVIGSEPYSSVCTFDT